MRKIALILLALCALVFIAPIGANAHAPPSTLTATPYVPNYTIDLYNGATAAPMPNTEVLGAVCSSPLMSNPASTGALHGARDAADATPMNPFTQYRSVLAGGSTLGYCST